MLRLYCVLILFISVLVLCPESTAQSPPTVFVQTDIQDPDAYPGGASTFPTGINNLGQVVGYYSGPSGEHGFLMTGSKFTNIDFPGAPITQTTPNGINDAGDIVGTYSSISCGPSLCGFLLSKGVFSTITFPGPPIVQTTPNGINDAGEIVGTVGTHGFLLSGGVFTTIDVPGATGTAPTCINNAGQVVGNYGYVNAGLFDSAGFLLSGGTFTTPCPE